MNTNYFLRQLHAKQDFRRDCIKPGTAATDKEKQLVTELLVSSGAITIYLEELKALDIIDKGGRKLSYAIHQGRYGDTSCALALDIFFGANPSIGIQLNEDGKGIEYVFGGFAHLISDKKQNEEFFDILVKNISDSTYPNLLNNKLRLQA